MATDQKTEYAHQLTSVHQPIYNLAMMLMNSIPAVGPAIAWGAAGVFPDPGLAARDQFIIGLAEKIDAFLEREQIETALRQEPAPALLSYAMSIASRSFGQEKLEALRNATVNGVFHSPQNVNLTALVFGILDRLTDGHISMLKEIGSQANAANNYVPWDRVKMLGVVVRSSPDGMKSPTNVLPIDGKESFVDGRDIETNEILLADMASLGLIEERIAAVPSVQEWSTDASRNLPGYAVVTPKGRLVLEHISDETTWSAPKSPPP
ncbi:hypothetical protein [Mesorhizobium sp. M0802]|uniref:hypothetical protein n=1 Tax=Mesorhizobium sp. M0802 TaxID=2957001 RepID=UPI003334D45E